MTLSEPCNDDGAMIFGSILVWISCGHRVPDIAAHKRHRYMVKPEVLVVDDNPFILDGWVDALSAEAKVYVMTSFEKLKTKVSGASKFLGRLHYVVIDMQLDGSDGDGLAVGRLLKNGAPTCLSCSAKMALLPRAS